MDYTKRINKYFNREIEAIKKLNVQDINEAINAINDARLRGANIYIFGNGGSAATASHFVCDFNKGISEHAKPKFKFQCLCDNLPILTAISNDISYDDVFLFQLKDVLKKDDLVVAVSGSGNSKNIIKAIEYAKEVGTKIVGITGYSGGKLKELSDYHLDAMVDDMQISEDIHMIFDHLMYNVLSK